MVTEMKRKLVSGVERMKIQTHQGMPSTCPTVVCPDTAEALLLLKIRQVSGAIHRICNYDAACSVKCFEGMCSDL